MFTFDSAVQEAQLLHSREEGCRQRSGDALFFSIFRKTAGRPVQRSYRMPQLEAVVHATAGQEDVYLSQSSFWSFSRQLVNFKQTRAAWVDLDVYNHGLKLDAALVNQILVHGEKLGIPAPTSVISSGRGCYLKWVFETPVTQSQLPTWNLLQSTLTAAYSSLAADFKARDAARVFRLLDTLNSKSGQQVECIEGSGKLYDFGGMCRAVEALRVDVLVDATKTRVSNLTRKADAMLGALNDGAARGDAQALALFSEIRQPILIEAMSARSLNWSRFCDLRDLYIGRGGIPVGERDLAMFWMLNFLGHSGVVSSQNWDVEVSELLRAFPNPATYNPQQDGSLGTLLNRLKAKEAGEKYLWRGREVDPLYRPSNEHLIEAFSIKPAEMAALSTVISPAEKQIRADLLNPGRNARREERNRWREEVREAFLAAQEQQKTDVDAVESVNMSALSRFVGAERTRVSRFWAELVRTGGEASKVTTKPRRAKPRADVVGENLPAPADLAQAMAALEISKQAHLKAQETERAVGALAIQMKLQKAQEAWARQKLRAVCFSQQSHHPSEEYTMATASTKLAKSKALLEAARKAGSAGAAPAEPSQNLTPASAAPQREMDPNWIPSAVPAAFTEMFDPSQWPEPENDGEVAEPNDIGTPHYDESDWVGLVGAPLMMTSSPPCADRAPSSAPVKTPSLRERLAAQAGRPGKPQESGARQSYQPSPSRAQQPAGRQAAPAVPAVPLVEGGYPAPAGFPTHDAWPSNDIPPGSQYSPEEWEASRTDAQGNAYCVVEIHTRQSTWLTQIPAPRSMRATRVVDGKMETHHEKAMPAGLSNPGMCDAMGQIFGDCILVAERAPYSFPGAGESGVQMGGINYTVVRPRRDFTDPDRAFRCGAVFSQPFDMQALIARLGDEAEEETPKDSPAPCN